MPACKFIGIDGLGASGKTTLANEIARALAPSHGGGTIIHTDDFYKPVDQRTIGLVPEIISPDFDWDRMEREVFIPPPARNATHSVAGGQPPFIVKGGAAAGEILIVVGVYALQSRFVSYYDFKIWVDCPRETRIKRMIEREGPAVAKQWQTNWLPREERYLEVDQPDTRADVIYENHH